MKTLLMILAVFCFGVVSVVSADSVTSAVQQKLKDQGFYYGDITGNNDADTTAAIRRYQIRNGLKITGELNAETQKSLGVRGNTPDKSSPPAPRRDESSATPVKPAPPEGPDLRDSEPVAPQRSPMSPQQPAVAPQPGYAPGPRGLNPETSGVFNGTPFEVAPADVQRRVVFGAQTLLARLGYYRGVIDGDFGPGTSNAIRAYQLRFGIASSGRLDMQTLGALGLLPGQRAPGIAFPRGRAYGPRAIAPNSGERLYVPR